jgi:hypothetical protein
MEVNNFMLWVSNKPRACLLLSLRLLVLLGSFTLPETKASTITSVEQSTKVATQVLIKGVDEGKEQQISLAPQRIRLPPPPLNMASSYDYFYDLLEVALNKTQAEYGPVILETLPSTLSQSRGLSSLNSGLIDITWSATSVEREQRYTPIRIPLIGGLLGIRVPVIKRARLAEFQAIRTPEQLKKFTACQGSQWPDSDILEANGYKVERIIMFELMYTMLDHDRCDYFPRGINEVFSELDGPGRDHLMAFEGILLRYSLPMYFFVSQENEQLERRLTTGLEAMVTSGELRQFITSHSVTLSMFPLSRYHKSLIFDLTNPILPANTPFERPEFWFDKLK